MVLEDLYSKIEECINNKDSIDDIYQYIVSADKKEKKKTKIKEDNYDSEIEYFKKVLKCDTVLARSIIKIKPLLSDEWIRLL
jgi:hypothetical protein